MRKVNLYFQKSHWETLVWWGLKGTEGKGMFAQPPQGIFDVNRVGEVSETFNYMMDILIHKELKENEENSSFLFIILHLYKSFFGLVRLWQQGMAMICCIVKFSY